MDMVNDQVFGQMKYNHRWVKQENIALWGNKHDVKIVAKAYSSKPITDAQRESYIFFKSNLAKISEETETLICKYVKDNLEDISIYWSNAKEYHSADEFNGDVTLTTVLFNQNGDIILLCDAVWDIESGLGIKIHPQYEIGPQDLFL